ncbi:prolipoprotein diacylglyceryl transferase [Helicobacter cholecystus]|uniref:Phosphatidylglycerol--prolipoprotein diacylglyceryl transferase n=1 Tax=Helicobacter cholecystus TaxID=45498 RepID=A0A3D8IY43_9HELI|nr:prolipoprotein diacylglyceryl transferase [Helicobacter cholecystus]RDU69973.1 prolipoprotein diacylglyceryl transferase [Helicobacter cholecystus]VEJ24859.1 prolipoprotein diacylglyceryl transferase [Helicobacter cholecystus]
MNDWYSQFNPIAFEIFSMKVHWYGIAYVLALISALWFASLFRKDPRFSEIDKKDLENYFLFAELGVILGARLGYILIYSPQRWEYLSAPWQIFNPFNARGDFVGISGMSYHGAIIGFLLASYIYAKIKNLNLFKYLDLMALSIPLAYVFGRIGNFLNHELYGRIIPENDVLWKPFGIYINGALRYPSQLIEAFLEGICVFIIVWICKKFFKFDGALIGVYALSYSLMRFIAEFYREPDEQMGYYGILSMGQILSLIMTLASIAILIYAKTRANEK